MFMKGKAKNKKGFSFLELIVVVIIITILAANGAIVYSKFIKRTMIAEGKMLVSSIEKIERLYKAESGDYKQFADTSYSKIPEIDARANKYFQTFSVYVPGNVTDSVFKVITKSELVALAGVEVALDVFDNKSDIMTVSYSGIISEQN
jgi:prepilin-type N-terminal cleavage/methylation domain-containing protein